MKKASVVVGAFLAFLLIVWGVLIVYGQHNSSSPDPVFEALGGVFVAVGLTFFWAVHRSKPN